MVLSSWFVFCCQNELISQRTLRKSNNVLFLNVVCFHSAHWTHSLYKALLKINRLNHSDGCFLKDEFAASIFLNS